MDPEELKKFLESMVGKMGNVDVMTPGFQDSETPSSEEQSAEAPGEQEADLDFLDFHYLPRDIKAHLDRFVIRQDEAKKALAIAVCDHYNHAKYLTSVSDESGKLPEGLEFQKQNIMVTGPTGVGKTYLIKHIADLIGVPFIKADATKFSETGYVGRDVDDLVRDLVKKADGDVSKAEYGIIYIDEIDKLASGGSNTGGRDVSGRGVQTTLLKLMEETEVPLTNPMDMQGQMMFMMGKNKQEKDTVNTRHILFIVSGAFSGLEPIITKRVKSGQIGFAAQTDLNEENENILRQSNTQDFIDYGLEAEFIGRLPVRVFCDKLYANDFANILKYSEGSLLKQYKREFEAYGIKATFQEDAIEYIAHLAEKEQTGARALMTVLESLLREFKYELPGTNISELNIDLDLLENREQRIEEYSKIGQVIDNEKAKQELQIFTKDFEEETGVALTFNEEALVELAQLKEAQGQSILQITKRLFQDYSYGVKLLKSKTGKGQITLTAESVKNPDKFLSDLVVTAYQSNSQKMYE